MLPAHARPCTRRYPSGLYPVTCIRHASGVYYPVPMALHCALRPFASAAWQVYMYIAAQMHVISHPPSFFSPFFFPLIVPSPLAPRPLHPIDPFVETPQQISVSVRPGRSLPPKLATAAKSVHSRTSGCGHAPCLAVGRWLQAARPSLMASAIIHHHSGSR
jgi:hypothetical protein